MARQDAGGFGSVTAGKALTIPSNRESYFVLGAFCSSVVTMVENEIPIQTALNRLSGSHHIVNKPARNEYKIATTTKAVQLTMSGLFPRPYNLNRSTTVGMSEEMLPQAKQARGGGAGAAARWVVGVICPLVRT
jgi:hypothetical protein